MLGERAKARLAELDGLLGPPLRGDVLHLVDEVVWSTVLIAAQGRGEQNPYHLPILTQVALLELRLVEGPVQGLGEPAVRHRPVVRVGDQLGGGGEQLRLGIAKQRAVGGVDLQIVAIRGQQRHADRRLIEGTAESLLALREDPFGVPASGQFGGLPLGHRQAHIERGQPGGTGQVVANAGLQGMVQLVRPLARRRQQDHGGLAPGESADPPAERQPVHTRHHPIEDHQRVLRSLAERPGGPRICHGGHHMPAALQGLAELRAGDGSLLDQQGVHRYLSSSAAGWPDPQFAQASPAGGRCPIAAALRPHRFTNYTGSIRLS